MPTSIDALAILRALREYQPGEEWCSPPRPFGPDGWGFTTARQTSSCLVTCDEHDGVEWVHASLTGFRTVPSYEALTVLHRAVWGDGWAYQVFAPPAEHINIHERCLHLFGRLDGKPALPDFTRGSGSI